MAQYRVWISFNGCACYDVEANSDSEAQDIAMDIADINDCDAWDFEVDEVEFSRV